VEHLVSTKIRTERRVAEELINELKHGKVSFLLKELNQTVAEF